MVDLVTAVRNYLLANQSVSDLIGQRMYLDVRPQSSSLPAATIYKASESHEHTISDRCGFVSTRLQIECYARKRLTANAVAEAMYRSGIAALHGKQLNLNFQAVQVEDGQRNYVVDDTEDGDSRTYVTQFDLLVSYREI